MVVVSNLLLTIQKHQTLNDVEGFFVLDDYWNLCLIRLIVMLKDLLCL